jgi:hypothetical protein
VGTLEPADVSCCVLLELEGPGGGTGINWAKEFWWLEKTATTINEMIERVIRHSSEIILFY